jgi:hypothetical protein
VYSLSFDYIVIVSSCNIDLLKGSSFSRGRIIMPVLVLERVIGVDMNFLV